MSEKNISKEPLRFLWHGWAFYPNALLTPDDFRDGNPQRYMQYLSIGQKVHLNPSSHPNEAHGSGTYMLRLRLPQRAAVYALELPEIFSSYRLYINDELLLQLVNPDPDSYKAATQNRIVTFEGSGDVLLLLAVSDYSHFYGGMVYPPAFGTPEAVNNYTSKRMAAAITLDTVAAIVAALSLYLGIRTKEKNTMLFAALCLTMLGSTSYTIVHTAFMLPIFPWYGLEMASTYSVTALVVVLHNRICGVNKTTARISAWAACFFCALALGYGLLAAYLPLNVLQVFSSLAFGYKAMTAAYLLVTAWRSVKVRDSYGRPLLYATVIFVAATICDRIYPVYEPVYGGWFSEWGSISIVLAAGYILWRDLVRSYSYSLAFAEEHRQVSRQLAMQVEYSRQLSQRAAESRRLVHDFRQHILAIDGIAEQFGDHGVREYLAQVVQNFSGGSLPHISFCDNIAADALLRYYFGLAKERGIEIEFEFSLPDNLPLTDVELCTVLGNLLENAVEACHRQKEGEHFLYLTSKATKYMLFILIENSFDGAVKKQDDKLLSNKSESKRFGVGIESTQRILEKYGGTLDVSPRENVFEAGVSLPLVQEAVQMG